MSKGIPNPIILYGGLPTRLSTALEHTQRVGESIEGWVNGGQLAVDAFIMARGMPEQDETDLTPMDAETLSAVCDGKASPILRKWEV
jgi:hypothetical protein